MAKAKKKGLASKAVSKSKPKSTAGKLAKKGAQALLGIKGGKGGKKRKTARQMLRQAYEKRAKHQIRIGALGQAKRTLRRKATVI